MSMSVTSSLISTQTSALPGIVLLCLCAAPGSFARSAATAETIDEMRVKAAPGIDEITPAAGSGYFAWSQNSLLRPTHFDAFAQRKGARAFKVNERNTQGRVGSISGRTLAYQQIRGSQADIKLLDLLTRRRRNPPRGVNTAQWESRPALSGNWLLFSRLDRATATERLLIRNLKTGYERVLSTLRREHRSWGFFVGQVSGNYAAASYCRGICRSFVYDISLQRAVPRKTQPLPETQYTAVSVTSRGTAYLAEISTLDSCGPDTRTELVKYGLDDFAPIGIRQFPPQLGIESTYAVMSKSTTTIYYSRGICSSGGSDIYAIAVRDGSRVTR